MSTIFQTKMHRLGTAASASVLPFLVVLPLAIIGVQLALDLDDALGVAGYSLYKLCFLIPPLLYCKIVGIRVLDDIIKPRNWRRCLSQALGLGAAAVLIFWAAYYALGELLLDRQLIVEKIGQQFSVNARTVMLVAPITIFMNSLLEEFFYRGFAFGLLERRHRAIAYSLPAAVFTVQHVLFIYHWVTPLPLLMAVAGLFVFALVLQKIYEAADSIVAPWLVHILGDVAMMGIAIELIYR